jgi:uncharacterized protein YcbK (DUF882 family)
MSGLIAFDSWHGVHKGDWPWANFTPEEMRCRGTGRLIVDRDFMDRLQTLRDLLGFALPVTSGYRTPDYNAQVSTTGHAGPHTTGRAADIAIYGERGFLLLARVKKLGFTGLGVKQHGPHVLRFIHLDDLADGDRPRPTIWSYP